jgi:hypothetical protein
VTNHRLDDRHELRRLVEDYAHFVDSREFDAVSKLFLPDGVLSGYDGSVQRYVRNGRGEIIEAMQGLLRYELTSHMLGQQRVDFDAEISDTAVGETYCNAQHIYTDNRDPDSTPSRRRNKVMSIRYHDRYVRRDGRWFFAERRLSFDFTETRDVDPAPGS